MASAARILRSPQLPKMLYPYPQRFVAPALHLLVTWLVAEIIAEFGLTRGAHNDGVNIAAKQGVTVGAAAKGRVAFVGRISALADLY